MRINGHINTTLTMKEISYLSSAIFIYTEKMRGRNNEELSRDMERIGNRLVHEMYSYPKTNHIRKGDIDAHKVYKYEAR